MLDIYIYERQDEYLNSLREICFRYLFKENVNAEIASAENNIQCALEKIKCSELQSIHIVCADENADIVFGTIRNSNADNYLVMSVDDISDIISLVKPSYRPSGFIVKPPQDTVVEQLLSEIYADYKRKSVQSGACFRFKIKAREFSIPFNSIMYFESSNKKTVLRTVAQEFSFYETFDEILQKCPNEFVRIHKSFIVNSTHIKMTDFSLMEVILDDESVIYFSRTYKNVVKELMSSKEGVI